ETKDVLKGQLDAYRASEEPDSQAYERICAVLRQLALEERGQGAVPADAAPAPVQSAPSQPVAPAAQAASAVPAPAATPTGASAAQAGQGPLCVRIVRVKPKDAQSLLEELGNLGRVLRSEQGEDTLTAWVDSTCSAE